MNDSDARVGAEMSLEQLGGSVHRTIVYDDDFNLLIIARKSRIHGADNYIFFVIGRNENAYRRLKGGAIRWR